MITIEGRAESLSEFASLVRAPAHTEFLGPAELAVQPAGGADESGAAVQRLTMRAPLAEGPQLVGAAKAAAAVRSARKSDGPLRIRVNPIDLS